MILILVSSNGKRCILTLAAVQLVLAFSTISAFVLLLWQNVNRDKTHELIFEREAPNDTLLESIYGSVLS